MRRKLTRDGTFAVMMKRRHAENACGVGRHTLAQRATTRRDSRHEWYDICGVTAVYGRCNMPDVKTTGGRNICGAIPSTRPAECVILSYGQPAGHNICGEHIQHTAGSARPWSVHQQVITVNLRLLAIQGSKQRACSSEK